MKRLGKILIPTDFSPCADQALALAVDLARSNAAALHLLHALVLHRYDPGVATEKLVEREEEIVGNWRELATARLSAAVDGARQDCARPEDLDLSTATQRGVSAADVILAYAVEQTCDLIVMGTHGRRGASHLLLGSVAEEVVRHADCPVLTVRERNEARLLSACEQILVPVDFSEHSRQAVSHAKHLASAIGARLQLLHVIEQIVHPAFYVTGKTSLLQIDSGLADRCRDNLQRLLDTAPGAAVEADFHLREGKATTEITAFAEEQASDLIVIATHGLSGLQHFLIGSVTQKVVRRAPCPVLTVKSFGRSFLD